MSDRYTRVLGRAAGLCLMGSVFALAAAGPLDTAFKSPANGSKPALQPTALKAADQPVSMMTAVVEHPENVLVRFRPNADAAQVAAAHDAAGVLEVLTEYTIVPGLVAVRVAPGAVHAAIDSYIKSGLVQYAEPDYMRYSAGIGRGHGHALGAASAGGAGALVQSTPYGISLVHAPQTWAMGARGAGVKVADLDTGMDIGHADLPTPVNTASFISGQAVQDGNDHGTHTAGTIGARDNTIGVIGVAPDCDLLIAKVLSNAGSGPTSGIISGVQWAVGQGATAINMSLGGGGFNQSFADACMAARNAGTVVVAASGNDGTAVVSYPGAYPGVIAVGAVDSGGAIASFSNTGTAMDLVGPGVAVLSTIPRTMTQTLPSVIWSGVSHTMTSLVGGTQTTVTAPAIFCSFGATAADFPATVSGKIAHIRRGSSDGSSVTFVTKCNNARNAGAVGVIISDNGNGSLSTWTLSGNTYTFPVVAISQTDGNTLQAASGVSTTISYVTNTTFGPEQYASFDGTSMATPHVTGVVALLRSAYPAGTLSADIIEQALNATALDLGVAGRDDTYGYGLVRADAALNWLRSHVILCPADVAIAGTGAVGHDGMVTGEDFDLFVQAYFTLQRDGQNLLIADIAIAGSGALGRDGFVTGEDFDVFVQQFFQGCP